jgi:hypothetical protein
MWIGDVPSLAFVMRPSLASDEIPACSHWLPCEDDDVKSQIHNYASFRSSKRHDQKGTS